MHCVNACKIIVCLHLVHNLLCQTPSEILHKLCYVAFPLCTQPIIKGHVYSTCSYHTHIQYTSTWYTHIIQSKEKTDTIYLNSSYELLNIVTLL